MMNIKQVLDAKGLACPMPIVRTKSNGYFANWRSVRNTCNG